MGQQTLDGAAAKRYVDGDATAEDVCHAGTALLSIRSTTLLSIHNTNLPITTTICHLQSDDWFRDVLPHVKQMTNFTYYEFTQNPGDMVIVPPGWFHNTLSFEKSVSLTFNMLNKYSVADSFKYICQRTKWNLGFSLKACAVLKVRGSKCSR